MMSDLNIEEQEFKDKELEAIEPVNPIIAGVDFTEQLTALDIETLRVDDLQGDIDMDEKYSE